VIKILPTLLIARYDPDKNASVIMNKVWSILQSDNDQTLSLTTHFRHLVDVLIENTTSKIWRRRVASCNALADIIVGRSWSDFGGGNGYFDEDDLLFEQAASSGNASSRLIRLINVTLRSLDDVRLAVREAGESLSLNVKNVIVNLCKRSGEHVDLNKDSEVSPDASATATFLPYLIKVGLNQSCAEAIQFSIVCLIEIIDTGSPIQIHSYIPSLIGSLLMSLSGLEPALLSHLQARAAGDAPGTERDVEQLRLRLADRSSLTSAITKVLNMVPALDLESQRLVVFQLDQALRSSHGLTTRNSVIDAIVSLCCKCPNAFDANPSTTRLLNALFAAIDHERKDTLMRGKFAYALGFVANLASAKTVRFLALKVCNSYLNNSDSTCVLETSIHFLLWYSTHSYSLL
jgi:proteasome component ECM29